MLLADKAYAIKVKKKVLDFNIVIRQYSCMKALLFYADYSVFLKGCSQVKVTLKKVSKL